MAVEQALSALDSLALAIESQSVAELASGFGVGVADVGALQDVYQQVGSSLRASVLTPQVRQMDAGGAEIDFLLLMEFADAQGEPISLPLPFRAFVTREATGWRVASAELRN